MVFLMCLSQDPPYNALNYAIGETKVGFISFLFGWIGGSRR